MEDLHTTPQSGKLVTVMTVKEWIISIILTCIPIVGIILLFVWAFSNNINENKRNWAKAFLIVQVIGLILVILIYILLIGSAIAMYKMNG